MAATVGELDRFEDLSVSSGTKKGPSFWEEAAPKPTRRGGDKGSAKAEVPKPSRRGRRKAAGEQEKEAVVMPGRHGRQKAGSQGEAGKGKGKGKGKKGPLPPAKNMMSEEDVMYILSWERREPYSRKNNKAAGFFNQLNDELFSTSRRSGMSLRRRATSRSQTTSRKTTSESTLKLTGLPTSRRRRLLLPLDLNLYSGFAPTSDLWDRWFIPGAVPEGRRRMYFASAAPRPRFRQPRMAAPCLEVADPQAEAGSCAGGGSSLAEDRVCCWEKAPPSSDSDDE
ncbi:hypothetical protein ZWY2020_030157 [Hordeum vulgare]|nr:hypothetical protein ZWY2020_030157 [Hordeum vulgare]